MIKQKKLERRVGFHIVGIKNIHWHLEAPHGSIYVVNPHYPKSNFEIPNVLLNNLEEMSEYVHGYKENIPKEIIAAWFSPLLSRIYKE